MTKIAFVYPSRSQVHASFTHDFALVVGATTHAGHAPAVYNSRGTLIFSQREHLAEEALKDGAEWIMWFDTDMRFPKDTALRLLAHDKLIAGINYATKEFPPGPTARNLLDDRSAWVPKHTRPTDKGIEKVDAIGMGAMLTSIEVFKKMDHPWFLFPYSTVNNTPLGEDLYFCMKAAGNGFSTWLDHDLSRECRHIGDFEFSLEHIDAFDEAVREAA